MRDADSAGRRGGVTGRDVLVSAVIFTVALPLCVGIAVASGVPVARGLLSGIIGGVVIGTYSGSPLLVSGPAAALAVMVFEFVTRFGVEALGPIVLIAGAIQWLCGRFGLGQWFRAVSPPVLHGLLGGIGVLVVASQVRIAAGLLPTGSGLRDLASLPGLIGDAARAGAGDPVAQALLVAAATVAVVAVAKVQHSPVPPALVGVLAGTGLVAGLGLEVPLLAVPENLLGEVSWLGGGSVAMLADGDLLLAGLALAVVASAETLLCATALDQLHDGEGTAYDDELVAQGLGNIACGVVGALPCVGLIVRSMANIEYGARTRTPAVLHGFWIAGFALVAPGLLGRVPVAALAGLLVFVGFQLAAKAPLTKMREYGTSEVMIYLATLVAILGLGLLRGVGLGVGLSILKLLYTFVHLEVRLEEKPERVELYLDGAATFLQLPRLTRALDRIDSASEVHLHLNELDYIDHACLELLSAWSERRERRGGRMIVEWDELSGLYHHRNRRIDAASVAAREAGASAPPGGADPGLAGLGSDGDVLAVESPA